MQKEPYVEKYLKFIDRLTARYNSRYWFSTSIAVKNRYAPSFFDDIYNYSHNPATFTGKRLSRFPFVRFFIISFIRTLRIWFRICLVRSVFLFKLRKVNLAGGIYLLRAGFYPASVDSNGNYTDQFFGRLPEYLQDNGKKVIIIGTVFSGNYFKIIKKISQVRKYIVIPQEYFASFFDPIKTFFGILKSRTKILDDIFFMGHNVTDIVKSQLNRDFCEYAFEHIFSFYITKNLTKKLKIETYTIIYENNPWQVLALGAVKTYSSSTRTIGYQHSIVSLARLNLVVGENEKKLMPIPDRIITNGAVTKDILINYGNFPPEKIRVGCALRFNLKNNRIQKKQKCHGSNRTILVALTALNPTAELLNLAYKTFKDLSNYRVIVRAHPGFPLNKMEKYLIVPPKELPASFIMSDKINIIDDLNRSDIMLYDESSVCLYSLLAGMPVIYINTDPIMNVDPLFECDSLKRKATNPSEILKAIEYFSDLDDNEFKKRQVLGRRYVESYLKPISEEGLRVFL